MSRPVADGRVRIVPSLLAADFARLGEAVAAVEPETDWVSVDVMDGHFVPNLSFGPDHVKAIRSRSRIAMDAHLMVTEPHKFGALFASAGADFVTAHVEAQGTDVFIAEVEAKGAVPGLAVKPGTPAAAIEKHLGRIGLALVMTVEPGFGGQAFLHEMLAKVRELRERIDRSGRPVWLMVDGGINAETAPLAAEAGADALVAGSSVFRAKDPGAKVLELKTAAQAAYDRGRKTVKR